MKNILLPLFLLMTIYSAAQVGIGTKIPEPSAMLEVKSNSKGVLISRMTETERAAIKSPAAGLLVYQTDGSAGFYYHTGSEWKYLPPAAIASAAQPLTYSTSGSSYTVSSVSGATNRITSSGGTAPVIDIASTYPGQSSITTLGTIGTGTWNGTVISSIKGGAGTVTGLMKANGLGTVSAAVSGTDYLKPNAAITAGTKTKLTYNAQGLVTGGSDASTTDIAEGNNKYYTDSRSRAALSLTTLGTSGAATYNKTTGVLNIPQYSVGSGGTTYSFASPLALNTGTVSIPQANSVASGYLTSTDWNTFNNKLSTATAASTYATIATVNGKVTSNNAITGATKTKITYDSKGLVTSGADATTTDIAEGTNLYFTEQRALNTVLSGFVAGPTSPVLTSDDIVSAFGKLQGQINKYDSLAEKISKYDSLQAQISKQDSLISLLNKRIDSLANATASDSSSIVNLSRGLVAYYPFTGNAGDSSGNGNHGTVNGATLTTDRFGNANKAYSFDGVNNWISVLHNSSLNPTSKISISFWEKSTSIHNNCGIIGKWNNFDGVSGNGQEQYVIYTGPNSQGVRFIVMTNNNASISDEHASVKYNDGIWHHFVGVYNGSNIKLYRDNVLIDSTSLTGSIKSFSQGLEIGRYSGGSGTGSNINYFNGLIDDIRIYDRDLTQSEISLLASDTLSSSSSLPILTTSSISDTTAISATSGGNITSAGGSSITARGIVWGTSSNPTISLSTKTTDGTGIGSYTSQIAGLTASTTYYVRAYATNTAGTAYGNEVSFTTNSINLTNGLVAYYPFTGNAGDSSGNGNHGTVNGATLTTDRFGNTNKAYSFDGINNFITLSNIAANGNAARSIFSWIKYNSLNTYLCFISSGNPANCQTFNLFSNMASAKGNIGVMGYNPCDLYGKDNNMNNDLWHYVGAVYDGAGTLKTYLDGKLIDIGGMSYSTSGQNNYIGKSNHVGNEAYFKGTLDDVRIYDRALTQSEISLLASDTLSTSSSLPVLTTTSISDTTAISATSGGNITSAGSTSITARGIVWGTSSNPTISLSTKTTDGTGTGSYSSQITGLTASTTYYVRAYATNTAGTAYGNEVSFTTNTINLTNGLVAYYPFTGNAGDSSGNGNHGTVNGATLTTDRFGNANTAYDFDGITNYIQCLKTGVIGNGPISLSLWYNTNSKQAQTVFSYGGVSWGSLFDASINWYPAGSIAPEGPSFVIQGSGISWGSQNPITPNWHHMVIVIPTNSIICTDIYAYLDGKLLGVYAYANYGSPSINFSNNYPIRIGKSITMETGLEYVGTNTFNGKLDEIRLYNRALTKSEITYLATH